MSISVLADTVVLPSLHCFRSNWC